MLALPPKADIDCGERYVCFVPVADIVRLFDHLVGVGEHGRGHIEVEHLGSLEIDDQLELRWLLDRKIGRLFALEDAIEVGSRAPVWVDPVRAVGDQAACGSKDLNRLQAIDGEPRVQ